MVTGRSSAGQEPGPAHREGGDGDVEAPVHPPPGASTIRADGMDAQGAVEVAEIRSRTPCVQGEQSLTLPSTVGAGDPFRL